MTLWLLRKVLRRAPRRFLLGSIGVAIPVAMLASTLLFVDGAVRSMTPVALRPVQIEMRALATSLNVDIRAVSRQLAGPGVRAVERFGAADVVVGTPGVRGKFTARLFAVDPSYLTRHPWTQVLQGRLGRGALLDQSLRLSAGFGSARNVTISLPGDAPRLSLHLPVNGTINLRHATSWFSVPFGSVQGDLVVVPRAIVIDYPTFERVILPKLRLWAARGGITPVIDPSLTNLPPADIEAHVFVDHSAFPSDPGRAATWSDQLRRYLERRAPGQILVADNTSEPLLEASTDATNAKIMFLLLGIPGVLVAAALGLAAASALSEAHRREEALLRLRGANSREIARLAAAEVAFAGVGGSVIGLLAAAGAVSWVAGHVAWQGIPVSSLVLACLAAVGAGAATTGLRLLRLRRAGRTGQVVAERRVLERGWAPAWRRGRLDVVALLVGILVLGVNIAAGGLRLSPTEGTTIVASFYALLAPIALWVGATLLSLRAFLGYLARRSRPDRTAQLPSWRGACFRWLGRRPARTAVALALGALAVAFGAEVASFTATYRTAKAADAHAAIGSDLRLTPGDPTLRLPPLSRDVAAVSPFRLVPARAGSDRKTILAIDPGSYHRTVTAAPRMLSGSGPSALAAQPSGVLVASEIARDYGVRPGDSFAVTVFPDDFENSLNLNLRVVGVFGSFPPTSPTTEMVISTSALPASLIMRPDFYLARAIPGRSPSVVAAGLRRGPLRNRFGVSTAGNPISRGLTALNLGGLSTIESYGAGLIAALGVGVLGAFLVLERRREFAILEAVGAETARVLTGPALEGVIAVLGSLAIGIPIGLGLGTLAVRILGLFFTLAPPVLSVPVVALGTMAIFVCLTSAVAIGAALVAVTRVRAAAVLRGA